MIKHDEEYYTRRKPKADLGPVENFKRFLWDPEKRAFLDRTGKEWADVGIFYTCFYGVLFSIFALQMYVTYKYVIAHQKPLLQYNRLETRAWFLEPGRRSMFGIKAMNFHGPGIDVRPNLLPKSNPPLILIDESKEESKLQKYVQAVRSSLSEYKVTDRSNFATNCSDRALRDESNAKPCFFDVQTLAKCSRAPYGYAPPIQPCVYIKFNKRFSWVPLFYSQASFLPESMPDWLKSYIQNADKFHVWLSCEGVSSEDRANAGDIEYLPAPGFPVQFFPYTGQPNYMAPVVALNFKNLASNRVVNIECKTWARNIDNEYRYNLNFRILIKNPASA